MTQLRVRMRLDRYGSDGPFRASYKILGRDWWFRRVTQAKIGGDAIHYEQILFNTKAEAIGHVEAEVAARLARWRRAGEHTFNILVA